jgi:glycosyltransferase involved in cell wall biosynthesis
MNHLLKSLDISEAPANILCLDQFSNLGGGQRSLIDILPAFSERGWHPSVAIPGEGPFTKILRRLGYRTHTFAFGGYKSQKKTLAQHLKYAYELPNVVEAITNLVETNDTDLIYVNGPRLVPPAAWVAWRRGIPLVFHCHNRLLQHSVITLTGVALELASAHVIACCEHAADPLREYVEPERLRVFYNGVKRMATGDFRSSRQIRNIGVVGRVEVEKGQLEFVKAARIVLAHAPQCRFKVIGAPMFTNNGYYSKVIAWSAGLPIEFVDWQNDIAQIYSDLDLLVVPSSALEATTRVILEAYSAGVPVVAFPVGGIPEVLKDGQTGFLADASNADALARRILSVLRMDPALLGAIVKNARAEWNNRFTLRKYQDKICSVLAQVLQLRFQTACRELHSSAGALTD